MIVVGRGGRGALTINRGLHRVRSRARSRLAWLDAKTPTSRRTIHIGARTAEFMRQHHRRQTEHRVSVGGGWQPTDLACDNGVGARSRRSAQVGVAHAWPQHAGLPPQAVRAPTAALDPSCGLGLGAPLRPALTVSASVVA